MIKNLSPLIYEVLNNQTNTHLTSAIKILKFSFNSLKYSKILDESSELTIDDVHKINEFVNQQELSKVFKYNLHPQLNFKDYILNEMGLKL
jgi:hypothetical protein